VTAVTVGRENMGPLLLLLLLLLYHYHYVVVVVVVSCQSLFSPGILLRNHCWSPAFRLQISDNRILLVMSDISKHMRLFFSESIECFPGMAFKTFFRTFVSIPVAPIM